MKTIKKFSAFTLAIMMFFGAIFSASADNTTLSNPPIFNDDPQLLQERLQRTFRSFNLTRDSNQYLTGSMYTQEKLKESGGEDYYSRTVRFYSLPALFGDENRPSALISDFYSMMRVANLRIRALNISNGQSNDNRSDLETECRRFALNASGNITDPNDRLMVEENAYDVMGEFLRHLISNENNIPSWWDTHFHRDRTRRLIKENKTINNIWSVSLLLATAIEEEKWKYTDENGETQYNDFLVTATDETITKPYIFPPFPFPVHFTWGTTLNPECAPASVKFVKSDPSLYSIDNNLKQQLPIKYEELHLEIWKFLGQFSPEARNVAERIEHELKFIKYYKRLEQEINELKTKLEGTLGSIIAAFVRLNQNEQAEFGRIWQALLESFNANYSNAQNTFNILQNLNRRVTEIRLQLPVMNISINDLMNAHAEQSEINREFRETFGTLSREISTLRTRSNLNASAFNASVRTAYDNGTPVFKYLLKILFPDAFIDRSELQCVAVTQ